MKMGTEDYASTRSKVVKMIQGIKTHASVQKGPTCRALAEEQKLFRLHERTVLDAIEVHTAGEF